MKILQVNYKMDIGGIENFLMNIYRNIDREKYEFIFLTYHKKKFDFEDEIYQLGGKIIKISDPNKVSITNHLKELYKVIKSENVDVVHCHTYFDSAYVMLIAKIAKVKVRIVHSHTAFALTEKSKLKHLKWFISRTLINMFSTKKIACSKEAGIALYKNSEFSIIPNGIDLEKFYFNEKDRREYRRKFGFKDDELIIGHIGRFSTPKNHKFLLEIFDNYTKMNENSKLILIGDGPLFTEIKDLIDQKNLNQKVILLGNRQDVNKVINALDIIVFPSIYEGFPVTLVETQANGLRAIISSNISKEVSLTECIKFLSLDKGAEIWAREIDNLDKSRLDTKKQLEKSDFSINSTIKKLTRIYENNN